MSSSSSSSPAPHLLITDKRFWRSAVTRLFGSLYLSLPPFPFLLPLLLYNGLKVGPLSADQTA